MARIIMIVKTTMHLDRLSAAALLPHFQSRNLECSSVSGASLSVPGLAMDFVASEGHGLQGGLSVVFDARARNSSKGGIRVTSVGTGDGDESAAADAASQWAMGVLPVIVSYILRSHVCEVEKLPMIVGVERLTGALRLDRPSRAGNRSCLWRVGLRRLTSRRPISIGGLHPGLPRVTSTRCSS
jgi:hypothetical protein